VVATVLVGDLSNRSSIAFTGLVALIFLLRTTPADAIKLRRRTSNLLIFGVAVLLMPWRWSGLWPPIVTVALLFLLRLTRRSPWWAVLFAWNPAVFTGGIWAAAAVVVPVLSLTGLMASAVFSAWIVAAGLFADVLWLYHTHRKM
jgi:hypothetical protein